MFRHEDDFEDEPASKDSQSRKAISSG
uniref:Uncharacterized protein n=1 Tax=Tetranychus urticae TaxID=32264 RepID=T1L110_TETUR